MTLFIASILVHSGGGPVTRFEIILISLVAGTGLLVSICWDIVEAWIKRTRGRNWPTTSGVIDIVSVAHCEPDGSPILYLKSSSYNPYYQAKLTYIYQYPDQQMGDYSRSFDNEDDAKAWANSYKGETIKVHVDPRDPTRSVLREEDL